MTDHKLTEEEQIALLRNCEKISSVKAPNQFGQKWVARVVSVTDGDTLNVAKYDETDGSLDRYILRVTEIGNFLSSNFIERRNKLINVPSKTVPKSSI